MSEHFESRLIHIEKRLTELEVDVASSMTAQKYYYESVEKQSERLDKIEAKIEGLVEKVTKHQIYLGLAVAVLSVVGSAVGGWIIQMLGQ